MDAKHRMLFIFSFLTILLMLSCNSSKTTKTDILNPIYKTYQIHGERGYSVSFSVDNEFEIPVAVIINRIEMPVWPSDRSGNNYQLKVIATSRLLQGYHPQGSTKDNGIIFEREGQKYFRAVNFVRQ